MMKRNNISLPRSIIAIFVFISAALIHWQCSVNQLTGGGSDTEVSGRIVSSGGAGAARAVVALIDTGYDPGSSDVLPANQLDTADIQGYFRFDSLLSGVYNLWAADSASGTQVFVNGVRVIAEKTNMLDDQILKKAADLVVPLPDSLQSGPGYVGIPGTFSSVRSATGATSVRFAALAQGVYRNVVYHRSVGEPAIVLFANVIIDSAGPFSLDPYASWQHYALVTLNTTAGGANVTETLLGFPMLIRLTSAELDFSQARREGEDLRVVRPDNSALPFEIEYWDSASSSAVLWVRADTIKGNAATQLGRIVWGNPSAKKTSRPATVFDTAQGFQGIWHLGESGPNNKLDATANGFTGTPVEMDGSSDVPGMAGRGVDFDGASQCVTVLNARQSRLDVQTDSFYTVSAWVYPRNLQRDNRVIVSKGSAQYGLMVNEQNKWEFYGGLRGYGVDTTTTAPAAVNAWTHLTGVRDGNRQYLFVNGLLADSTTSAVGVGASVSNNFYDLVIGRQSDDESQWFDGMADEVRVENRARPPAWIRLCYENQRTGQRFVQVQKVR